MVVVVPLVELGDDRFVSNMDKDEDTYSQSTPWASTDEHRNAVVWKLEDSFTKMEFHSV